MFRLYNHPYIIILLHYTQLFVKGNTFIKKNSEIKQLNFISKSDIIFLV